DLLPKFSLVGSLGLQSSKTNNLGDWNSRYFNIGPSVSWPIFDAGRLNAMVHVRSAQQEQALLHYRQTVLNALREVEDAMIALHTERQRSRSLHQSEQADAQSAQLAEDLYRRGLTDFLTVLDAQHRLYQSQDALARSQANVTTDAIALYKALGGGWEDE
ncbi:MAG TPA: TolC family protein, partial [Tepidisphaeraceae bacterium]|nr:TolC family protein [Tepidisphaeraceae bacterium]